MQLAQHFVNTRLDEMQISPDDHVFCNLDIVNFIMTMGLRQSSTHKFVGMIIIFEIGSSIFGIIQSAFSAVYTTIKRIGELTMTVQPVLNTDSQSAFSEIGELTEQPVLNTDWESEWDKLFPLSNFSDTDTLSRPKYVSESNFVFIDNMKTNDHFRTLYFNFVKQLNRSGYDTCYIPVHEPETTINWKSEYDRLENHWIGKDWDDDWDDDVGITVHLP